jgi:integrase
MRQQRPSWNCSNHSAPATTTAETLCPDYCLLVLGRQLLAHHPGSICGVYEAVSYITTCPAAPLRAPDWNGSMASAPKKLLDQVREALRTKHYSIRTEESYIDWITRYIRFHQLRHPRELGLTEIEAFLSDLAVTSQVAASTQNQARSALLFLYRQVLDIPLDAPRDVVLAKVPQRLPTVLTKAEVQAVLRELAEPYRLMAQLLYGSGLRLMECVRLRVKDLDFSHHEVSVRDGKGEKDRVTMLPERLTAPLQLQLQIVKRWHDSDLERGYGAVYLPFALERKYPNASREWGCSISSRPIGSRKIRAREYCGATISMRVGCRRQ